MAYSMLPSVNDCTIQSELSYQRIPLLLRQITNSSGLSMTYMCKQLIPVPELQITFNYRPICPLYEQVYEIYFVNNYNHCYFFSP